MPRATFPGVGNKSLPDQRTATPHTVSNNPAIPTGRTIRHNSESGSPNRVSLLGEGDVDLCSTAISAPGLFILIRLPRVWLHRCLVGHKRRVRVILEMRGAIQNPSLASELLDLLEVGLTQSKVGVFHTVGRFA